MSWAAVPFGLLFCGSLGYCALTSFAAWRHRQSCRKRAPSPTSSTPISVLKPLAGADTGLRENLESFFSQSYDEFELLFAVRHESDPAVAIVEQLRRSYPGVPARLIVTGEPPYPNAKVFSLSLMCEAASHDWLLMSDSDIRVGPDFLSRISNEISSNRYDLASCPYRAIPGGGIWSLLEALGMNSEFWGGVVAAKQVEGVHFTVGPTTVAHRKVIDAVPWASLSRYLAEDFVLGQKAAELGFRVDLSCCVVQHRLPAENAKANLSHRLRWARSSRRSRPAGYLGQVFMFPLALGILTALAAPRLLPPVLASAAIFRAAAVFSVETWVLHDTLCRRYFPLLILQDLLGFAVWLAGFVGNEISWRGRRYYLRRDGTFDPIG
jgi:ceramide glucosyltransferase